MIKETPADRLIEKLAEKLKSIPEIKPPEWSAFVKTGVHKERPPQSPDWWWTRAASILRKISLGGPVGVSNLRKEYGGRKNRGHKPEHKKRAGGSVIRHAIQQLEAAGLVEKSKSKGRAVTKKGTALLNEAGKKS